MKDAGKLLSANLAQEQATDKALETLATGELNAAANNRSDDAGMKSAKSAGRSKAGRAA
jgi:hypothetical protein